MAEGTLSRYQERQQDKARRQRDHDKRSKSAERVRVRLEVAMAGGGAHSVGAIKEFPDFEAARLVEAGAASYIDEQEA